MDLKMFFGELLKQETMAKSKRKISEWKKKNKEKLSLTKQMAGSRHFVDYTITKCIFRKQEFYTIGRYKIQIGPKEITIVAQ